MISLKLTIPEWEALKMALSQIKAGLEVLKSQKVDINVLCVGMEFGMSDFLKGESVKESDLVETLEMQKKDAEKNIVLIDSILNKL